MHNDSERPMILLGAGGLVGRRIVRGMDQTGRACVRVGRCDPADVLWDMDDPAPPCPQARGAGVVVLAGVTPVGKRNLHDNTRLAQAGIAAARDWGAAHIFVMSTSALYAGHSPAPLPEHGPLNTQAGYAHAKAAMEAATAAPDVTALRLANVAGASQPFLAIRDGYARLDRFTAADAPSRSFIGPVALARALAALCDLAAAGHTLPPVLNVGSRNPLPMLDIFTAAGVTPDRPPAPAHAVAYAHMATDLLDSLWPVPHQSAEDLWRETCLTDPP